MVYLSVSESYLMAEWWGDGGGGGGGGGQLPLGLDAVRQQGNESRF